MAAKFVVLLLEIIIAMILIDECLAKTKCIRGVGKLICETDPSKAKNVRIDLVDHDGLPLEIDDHMGQTWSTANGSFDISGCGHDVGPWNTPDPYLRITHQCPPESNPSQTGQSRKIEVYIWPTFLPKISRIGTIYLEEEHNNERRLI